MFEKIVKMCGKHDAQIGAFGFCPDCCAEDHRCYVCGLYSHEGKANVEWRGAPFSGAGQTLCDNCVECADCGGSVEDADDRHWNYDEYLCDSCVQERDEEWERDEKEQEARSASTLS
jgi:hypothetical protein